MSTLEKDKGEHKLIHNPGHDFRRVVYWMKKIDTNGDQSLIAPYFIPILALLGACCAIEGYVNTVGQHIDPKWADFEKGPIPLRKRLQRIYANLNKNLELGQGLWQEVFQGKKRTRASCLRQ
jgi:hypothetical protein